MAAAAPDYTGVEDSIKQGYNAQRQKAAQTEASNLQGQRDALARRAAALGNAPGGAFVKAEQQAGDESAQRGQQASATIDDAQNAELRGLKMTQLGQQYTTSERLGSEAHADTAQQKGLDAQSTLQDRQIAAQKLMQETGISSQEAMQKVGITAQADLQASEQKFQNVQASDARNTAIVEAQKNRDFQNVQASDARNAASVEAEKQRAFLNDQGNADRNVKVEEFLQTIGLSREQFQEQTGVDMFNEHIAQQMADKKDMLEKTFDQFGMNKIKNMFQGASGNGTTADTGNVLGGAFKGLGGIFG